MQQDYVEILNKIKPYWKDVDIWFQKGRLEFLLEFNGIITDSMDDNDEPTELTYVLEKLYDEFIGLSKE